MLRWLCSDGPRDSWQYVHMKLPDVPLILVWRDIDRNWAYQIVNTSVIGVRTRRGDAMAAAVRHYEAMQMITA